MVLIHDHMRFCYECHGAGEPVLCLHGNGEDSAYFHHQIEPFSQEGYQIITMDMRGHGCSAFGDRPHSFSLFVEDVKALLDHLGIETVTIIGFSDGANTAMMFALRYPAYVKGLVLNAGNLTPWGMKWNVLWDVWRAYRSAHGHKKEILSLMIKEPHIFKSQLQKLSIPTLVIAGEHDMIRDRHTKKIARCIPDAQLVIVPGCDHFLAEQQPDSFNEPVLRFLKGS